MTTAGSRHLPVNWRVCGCWSQSPLSPAACRYNEGANLTVIFPYVGTDNSLPFCFSVIRPFSFRLVARVWCKIILKLESRQGGNFRLRFWRILGLSGRGGGRSVRSGLQSAESPSTPAITGTPEFSAAAGCGRASSACPPP